MTKFTERALLDALWDRLCRPVNGATPRYVMAEHVRHDPTFGSSIADAIAVDTWGSGKFALEAYEVKTTRSDWRRELPAGSWFDRDEKTRHEVPYVKSYPWRRHCARWYVLAPEGVVPVTDLPDGWGLIEWWPQTGLLRSRVKADNRPADALPLNPRQVAGLMRATAQTAAYHSHRLTLPETATL